MGPVKVKGSIGVSRGALREVEFVVDTGSFYTFLPPSLAAELGIALPVTLRVVLADSRTVEVSLGVAYLQLANRGGGVLVGSLEVPMPLLGASALEALGLKVDPVNSSLEPSRPFGPAELGGVTFRALQGHGVYTKAEGAKW